MGTVWEKVRTKFSDGNVVPGTTRYVDPGTCITVKNHDDRLGPANGLFDKLTDLSYTVPNH